MICPKCGASGCKYNQRRTHHSRDKFKRTDFTATCKKCGFEGEA